jgi:RNA polymerase sigma factor (sigma-70 family)
MAHKGLVLKVLQNYRRAAYEHSSADLDDLIQEGLIAVHRKIGSHDPNRGAMSTYLTPWIHDAMQRYLRKRSLFRKTLSTKSAKLAEYVQYYDLYSAEQYGSEDISPEQLLEGIQTAREVVDEYLEIQLKSYARKSNTKYQAALQFSNLTDIKILDTMIEYPS